MARRQAAEHEPLIIDRAAAAEIPSEQAVREWAHGRRGFISGLAHSAHYDAVIDVAADWMVAWLRDVPRS